MFRQGLQVQLQERYRRLLKSSSQSFAANVRYFVEWADSVPAIRSILELVALSVPTLDPVEWRESASWHSGVDWPATEVGRAKVVLDALRAIARGDVDGPMFAHELYGGGDLTDGVRELVSDAVEPLVEFVQSNLAAESDMLYLLERYRRRVLWFEQDRLWAEFRADTQRGEAVYDRDLRHFLFDQGIDFPWSQPESPSGKADVVANIESDDPFACEVKLFDGDSYGPAYLGKGVGQALRYAGDYGKTSGYLVIVNLTAQNLVLPTDEPEAQWRPRLLIGDATIFLVVVQGAPRASASASGKPKATTISRDTLVQDL